jgi:hypothetical protein
LNQYVEHPAGGKNDCSFELTLSEFHEFAAQGSTIKELATRQGKASPLYRLHFNPSNKIEYTTLTKAGFLNKIAQSDQLERVYCQRSICVYNSAYKTNQETCFIYAHTIIRGPGGVRHNYRPGGCPNIKFSYHPNRNQPGSRSNSWAGSPRSAGRTDSLSHTHRDPRTPHLFSGDKE